MAQTPSGTRQYKDLLGFFEGVNSYLEPQLIKDSQVRWAENAVCKGGIWQTRPGYKTLMSLCLNQGSAFNNWWIATGQPVLHPQFFTTFQPFNSDPYVVFAISGSVFFAPLLSDSSIGTMQQITNLSFDPHADFIVATPTVKSTDIVGGKVVNITPQRVLMMQDGKSRAGYWNGLASGHLNPQKLWTVDGTGNTIFTPGFNQTRIGLWQAWSGNRLWVFNGSQGFASDINDPLNFTEETVLTQIPVFNFPEDVTGAIDRGTSGVQQGLLFVGTGGSMWAIHSGIQDRTQWITTPDFQRIVFAGVGCVAGKSMVNHRGLLYWYSGDGIVSFDSLGTVISTQALPAIDYEMTNSKRRMSPLRTGVCSGFRDSYVFWSVPVGPTKNGRTYNGHTQVIDRMTVPLPAAGGITPTGITAWQGVWTGIRPIEWSTAAIFGQTRALCMSMDYDGIIRIWEAFQGNRADNGFQIPWAIETKSNPVTESPFVVNTFRYFQLLLEQIQGNLEMRGFYRGLRGQYHQLLDTEVTATPGSILTPTPAYSPIKFGTANESFSKQFRDIPSKNTSDGGVSPVCQSSEVESPHEDAIDRAFSLLIRFRGVGALLAYRLATDLWPQNTEGEVIDAETGLHILPEQSCPQLIPGTLPDYILQDKLAADALVPYESKFIEEDYAAIIPDQLKCPPFMILGPVQCGGTYDFGTSPGGPLDVVFTITNIGVGDLVIGTISTSNPNDFFVLSQPVLTTIPSGESTIFTVRMTTTGFFKSALLFVPNNAQTPFCEVVLIGQGLGNIRYEQADGPFAFPPLAFSANGLFYTDQTAGGNNAVKNVNIPNDPNAFTCDIPPIGTATGKTLTTWAGLAHYDINTNLITGAITVTLIESGTLPGGGANRAARPTTIFNSDSVDAAFTALAALGGAFAAQDYFAYQTSEDGYLRKWITTTPTVPGHGYFVNGFMNVIWCPGFVMTVAYSGIITVWQLGATVARTGIPARTQVLVTYNAGTLTYTGNKSRAVITQIIGPAQTFLVGQYTFLVTPNAGAPYLYYSSTEYNVTPGSTFDVNVEYPWIVGASVYLQSAEFYPFRNVFDDFETYAVADYISLPGILQWNSPSVFTCLPPNGDVWDGFQNYDLGGATVSNLLLSLNTGYAWNGGGIFNGVDNADVLDDFEGYSVGTSYLFDQGVGWNGFGMTSTVFEHAVDDDLESYPAGTITSMAGGTGFYWAGNGIFA